MVDDEYDSLFVCVDDFGEDVLSTSYRGTTLKFCENGNNIVPRGYIDIYTILSFGQKIYVVSVLEVLTRDTCFLA